MQHFFAVLINFWTQVHMPILRWTDFIEILIIAFLVYHMLNWAKNTRAWALLRGVAVIGVFVAIAAFFNMTTILWISRNVTGLAVIAIVIVLQPELRAAIEELGQQNFLSSLFRIEKKTPEGRFSDNTINEIIRACTMMARVRTGALIVIEQTSSLQEEERTGITIDAAVSSQLLINIFEKNTPLHDGAVIIRGNRIAAATCYLPISDSRMDKTLGTRHRAGVGISEKGDSLTLIVSEENGSISIAYKGMLYRNVDEEIMRKWLTELQNKLEEEEEAAAEAAGEPLFRWSGFFRKGQTGAKNEDKTEDPE